MFTPFVRRLPKRFIKFCIVGSTSTVIDVGFLTLLKEIGVNLYLAVSIAFTVAVTNGYYWNRRWTFVDAPRKRIRHQFPQFVLANIVGLSINLGIMKLGTLLMLPYYHGSLPRFYYIPLKIIAIGVTVFWNFLSNKYWTFS